MPFKKVGKSYKSPSGRTFSEKQVKLYYATEGFKRTPKAAKATKMKVPQADKKGTPDFQRNPRSVFKSKPKGLAKPRGKKV
jgi:hypothetical protein